MGAESFVIDDISLNFIHERKEERTT